MGGNLSAELDHISRALAPSASYSFQKMFEGENARARFIDHLIEWYHYAKTVCPQMALARSKFNGTYPRVNDYLARHIDEERGHDEILLSDLERLGFTRAEVECHPPSREIMNLIGSQYYVINELHPVGLLGHIYALESHPPTAELIHELSDRLAIAESALSFYFAHCEADVQHIADLRGLLDGEVFEPDVERVIKYNLQTTMENLADFFLAVAVRSHWSPRSQHPDL